MKIKKKIGFIFGAAIVFLLSASSMIWYLNSGSCRSGSCADDVYASATYSVCITGDSISYGKGDSFGGWVKRLEYYLFDRYPGSSVGNYSLPGATSLGAYEMYDSGCGSQKPEVSIIAVGINDAARSMDKEVFKNNITRLYEKASVDSAKVAFVGLTSVDENKLNGLNYRNESIASYDDELKTLSASLGADYISLRGLLTITDFSDDGMHPNDFGHEKIFLQVRDYIEKIGK
jgi:lysophospholipase L1-like esterase